MTNCDQVSKQIAARPAKRASHADLTFGDFDFEVPDRLFERQHVPVEDVRMMVVDARSGEIGDRMFSDLPEYIGAKDLLVRNRSGMSRSRLSGEAAGGAHVDICFLLESTTEPQVWEVIVLAEGEPPTAGSFSLADGAIAGEFLGKLRDFDGSYWVERNRFQGYRGRIRVEQDSATLRATVEASGLLMHPWYTDLHDLSPEDLNPPGTFGEPSVLLSEPGRRVDFGMWDELAGKGALCIDVHLAMSFSWNQSRPDQRLLDYEMNEESFSIQAEQAARLRAGLEQGRTVTSVGTSGVRVLESLGDCSAREGRTSLFVSPGFRFKYCDNLLTHFHNPMGTHVIMASAFGGRELVLEACRRAVREEYCFGIHGDAMLVIGDARGR